VSVSLEKAEQLLTAQTLPEELIQKWQSLIHILEGLESVAVAYSGGVDSTLLAYSAAVVLGNQSVAVFIDSELETEQQKNNARQWANQMGFTMHTLPYSPLSDPQLASNPIRRCYFCKQHILNAIHEYASANGLKNIVEGQNVDDLTVYRPGRQAVNETGTKSPLAEAGLTKAEIRTLAKALSIPVWNLPSSACLATRFPYGSTITSEGLRRVETAEEYLHSLGYEPVRVRIHDNLARVEIPPSQFPQFMEQVGRVTDHFSSLGFAFTTLDLNGFRSGSFDEGLSK
jgi:pyridinium-3,5-biscarboxylic acid mononucleotide sulfurtransferase